MSAAAELTPDTEQHLRKRLAASQIRMSERHPFFGALLMLAPVELTDTVPTAATDGRQLLFNPAFLQGLSTAELDGLVIHELLHCAFLHVPRRRDRDATLWNVACDIHINGLIRTLEGLSLPKGGVEDSKLAHLSVEEIYAALLQSGKVRKLALADLLDGTMDAAAAEQLSAHWSDAMHRAVAAAQMHGFGSVPEAILRAVQETHAPQLDWRSALWRHVVRTPDDFAGFDRRPHQTQSPHAVALQRRDRRRDRQIGLAGTGRADAKADVATLDIAQIKPLVGAARFDDHAARLRDHFLIVGFAFKPRQRGRRILQAQMHVGRRQKLVASGGVQIAKDFAGGVALALRAGDVEHVAAIADFHAETALDQSQVFIKLPA